MAGEDSLLGILGNNDLTTFQNSVQQSNPYGIAGLSLGAAKFNTDTWSPTETAATSFGKAFLQGLLGRYAQQDAAEQTNKIIAVLPQLKSDPMSVTLPEGVNESAFATLKANSVLKNQLAAAEQESNLTKLLQSLKLAGPMAAAQSEGKTLGEIRANAALGDAAATIPGTPAYEAKQDTIKVANDKTAIERNLANDFTNRIANFKLKEEGLKALTEAYQDKSGTSDYEIIRRGAQAVEPGLAVRADDIDSIKGAASVLGMSTEAIKAAISGTTKLSPDVRAGILRIAKRSYNSSLDDYNTIRDNFSERAKAAQLSAAAVVPYGAARPFEELYPKLDISGGTSAAPDVPPGMKLQRNKVTGETRLVAQ